MSVEEKVQEQIDAYKGATEREVELRRRHRRSVREANQQRGLCRSLIESLEKALSE